MNRFSVTPELQVQENSGYFDTEIKCIFQKGPWQKTEVIGHSLKDQLITYNISFCHDALTDGTPYPLTLTVLASTKARNLSEETIRFMETKLLPLGKESSLKITLGKSFLNVPGWTITTLRGHYPNEIGEFVPRNISYNTIINTNNIVPESILNLEAKPITKTFELKLSSGFATESRSISVSSFIPKQVDIDSYIFNLSDRLLSFDLTINPKVIPDSKLGFFINPQSPLEFKVSSIKNLGFLYKV